MRVGKTDEAPSGRTVLFKKPLGNADRNVCVTSPACSLIRLNWQNRIFVWDKIVTEVFAFASFFYKKILLALCLYYHILPYLTQPSRACWFIGGRSCCHLLFLSFFWLPLSYLITNHWRIIRKELQNQNYFLVHWVKKERSRSSAGHQVWEWVDDDEGEQRNACDDGGGDGGGAELSFL